MEENKELLEYVKEIRDLNKKRLWWSRITSCVLVIFVVGVLSIVPTVNKTLVTTNQTLENLDSKITEFGTAISKVEIAMDSVTDMTNVASKSLTEAMDNLNSIDFEGLNSAITDLGAVVEPLANFFGKFSR